MVKAVIFDLDGTLLDTLEDLANAVNAALRHAEMPVHSIDDVRMFVGNGVKKLMECAIPGGEKTIRNLTVPISISANIMRRIVKRIQSSILGSGSF